MIGEGVMGKGVIQNKGRGYVRGYGKWEGIMSK